MFKRLHRTLLPKDGIQFSINTIPTATVYCDYTPEELHDFISRNYGVSLIRPHAMVRLIEEIPGIRIFLYNERAWGDHQDVVAFGRPSFDLPWPSI